MNPSQDDFSTYPLRRQSMWHLRDGFWDVLLALPLFLAYLTSLQEGVGWWDSGELVAAIKQLTVAHRPGFPLYVVVGHVLAGWAGDPRFVGNLISAASGALAMLFIWRAFRLQAGGGARTAIWILAGGWLVGFSPLFWRQAVRAEVYTPAYLAIALALLLTVSAQRAPDPRFAFRRFLGAAYCAGLAFCTHTALALAAWPALIYLFVRGDFRPSLRQWAFAAAACTAGLSVYLYVPLRAAHAPYVWGDPSTLPGLWQFLTASDSFGIIAGEAGGTPARLLALLGVLRDHTPALLVIVGGAGIIFGAFQPRARDRAPLWLACAGGLIAATVVSTVIPDNLDLQAYLFPLLLAAWWGWNILDPSRWSHAVDLSPARARLATAVTAVVLIGAATLAFREGRAATAQFRLGTADRWATSLLTNAQDGELLVLQDANTDFMLRGLMASDSALPAVAVLNTSLAPAAWYRRWWTARYLGAAAPQFAGDRDWPRAVATWWRERGGDVHVDYGCDGWTNDELAADGWLARWDSSAREANDVPKFTVVGAEADPDWVRTAVWFYYRLGQHYLGRGSVLAAARSWDEGLRWSPGEPALEGLRAELAQAGHAQLEAVDGGAHGSP
jgi:hypothetical protein